MSPIRHGTVDGYSNRKCRCNLCRGAWADYLHEVKRVRILRLAKDPSLVEHGKETTYLNWGCRCEPCRAAKAEAAARRRARA